MIANALLVGTIPAILACIGAIGSAWISHRAKQDIKRVEKKVDPVSNGFSRTVLDALVDIREELRSQRSDITQGRDAIVMVQRVLNQHLEDHEKARRRARKRATPPRTAE